MRCGCECGTYEWTELGLAAADHDFVLLAIGGHVVDVVAALALRPEEVVVVAVGVEVGALDRGRGRIGGDSDGLVAEPLQSVGEQGGLLNTTPEGAESEDVRVVRHEQVAVDGVVGVARGGLDARAAVVCPGAWVHGARGCDADGAVLRAEGGD